MPTKFKASDFVPTQSSSAEEKAKFANQFVKFVSSGFQLRHFTKSFYRRLSMTFGHIAHYNQDGFYAEWFETPEDQLKFVKHCLDYPAYGQPEYTYCDVEKALKSWLFAENIPYYKPTISAPTEFVIAATSQNANSFGLKGQILVARDGTVYEAAINYINEQPTGTIIKVSVSDGEPEFYRLGYEIPRRRPNCPANIVEEVWAKAKTAV